MVEGAGFNQEALVFMPLADEAAHLVGVHGPFAQEGEDREGPVQLLRWEGEGFHGS
jgi:hypothetical protein